MAAVIISAAPDPHSALNSIQEYVLTLSSSKYYASFLLALSLPYLSLPYFLMTIPLMMQNFMVSLKGIVITND